MRRRKRSTSLFEVLNSSKPAKSAEPTAVSHEHKAGREQHAGEVGSERVSPNRAGSDKAGSDPIQQGASRTPSQRSRIDGLLADPEIGDQQSGQQQAPNSTRDWSPDDDWSPDQDWPEDQVAGDKEGGSARLPGLAATATSYDEFHETESFWSWLNSTEELRRMTLVVGGVVIVLLMCIAFQSGRSVERSKQPVELADGYVPIGIMDPPPHDGQEKPAVRNVNAAVSGGLSEQGDGVSEESQDQDRDAADDSTSEEERSAVPAEKVWIVAVSTTKDTASGTSVVRYLRRMVPFTANLRRSSSRTGSSVFEVYVGSFESRDDAKQALRRVSILPKFQGTDFSGAYLRQVENLNNAEMDD